MAQHTQADSTSSRNDATRPATGASSASGRDRRLAPRRTIVRSAKLLHAERAVFIAGTTSNVSSGGALMCIDRSRPIRAGDHVELAIDWVNTPVIKAGAMTPGKVVRVTPIDCHTQAVAIAYQKAQGLEAAA